MEQWLMETDIAARLLHRQRQSVGDSTAERPPAATAAAAELDGRRRRRLPRRRPHLQARPQGARSEFVSFLFDIVLIGQI